MKDPIMQFENYEMRLIKISDIDDYYKSGFENPDMESNYYTANTDKYSKEQIQQYVEKIVSDDSRYDFIISCEGEIIGEVVLNDITGSNGHYRISIFSKDNFSKGIGYNATVKVLEYAFKEIGLETIDLKYFHLTREALVYMRN